VLEAVSFALGPGDALVLRGRNGSGKSSLLRLLAGFVPLAAGSVAWAGQDIRADPAGHRCRLHYVGHGDAVKPVLTVRENIETAAALAGGGSAVEAALDAMDLLPLAGTPGRFLSAGQHRRVALARLAASARPLWLLDEPGTGLDRASRLRLEAMIERHRATGGICVVATHGDVTVPRPFRLDLDA
jgi:heme exporter protein A